MRREAVGSLVGARTTRSLVAYPTDEEACRETIRFCRRNGLTLCPRGGRHSYGDVVLNDGHVILDTARMDRILHFDEYRGRIVVQPGVRIIDIYRTAYPRRFTLPASPSEATVTVAGAIANNVSGKDGWRVGSFGDRVLSLELLTASGDIVCVDRDLDRELFRAVIGGMGLLGVIVEVTLQLQRIASPYVATTRVPVGDVDELVERLAELEADSDFAVAWVDTCARGDNLGRAMIHSTKWVEPAGKGAGSDDDIAGGLRRLDRVRRRARVLCRFLSYPIALLMQFQRLTVGSFNRLYYAGCKRRAARASGRTVETFVEYNFRPDQQIPPPARFCGPEGFAIEASVPRAAARETISEMIGICQQAPCPPVTTILRSHRRDDYLISFSDDGYSLNFEFHPKRRHAARMRGVADALIECTIRRGGKVHLAKDMILTCEQFCRLYPNHQAFADIKRVLDPEGLFSSDLHRRLFPTEAERETETEPAVYQASGSP